MSAARTNNSSPTNSEIEKDAVEEAVNGSVYPIMYPPPPHGYYPQTNQHQAFGPDGQPIPRYLTTCYPFVQESYIYMPHYRQVSQETQKKNERPTHHYHGDQVSKIMFAQLEVNHSHFIFLISRCAVL